MKFLSKVFYYGTLVGPIYRFLKDVIQGGYAQYINHQQEIETARMYAKMRQDELSNMTAEDFFAQFKQIVERRKK